MINKRYTDEEIVKALECCLCDNSECLQCQKKELCRIECDELATKTIDLINCQKAEIERLKGSTIVNNIMESQRIKREAKSEAYKEFAEKLKEKLDDCYIVSDGEYCGFDCGDVHKCIENILIEMVGEIK